MNQDNMNQGKRESGQNMNQGEQTGIQSEPTQINMNQDEHESW